MSLRPLAMTSSAFVDAADGPRDRALARYRAAFRCGETGPDVALPDRAPARRQDEGDTVKFIIRHEDGLETESVVLPQRSRTGRPRLTLCLSSQIGCAMGCTFCETARMGLLRNLTVEQIVAQWFVARHGLGAAITNVVFMGMGEPMDNLDAVIDAIRVLVDANGPALAASRIAVSTVGHVPGIRRLAAVATEPGLRRLRLAVSVNAPNDAIRSSIMPMNRAAPMSRLMNAMLDWPATPNRPVLVEYVLIPGVNDADAHADELASYLAPLPCTVNVIPYNPRRDSPWPAPAEDSVTRFVERLAARGQRVTRRRTMGRDVMAACGQLGNPTVRRR